MSVVAAGPGPGSAATRVVRERLRAAADRFVGIDPGQIQLRVALRAVLGIALALLLEYVFVRATGAMQVHAPAGAITAQQAALIDAQHHGVRVVAMLLGALAAMISSFAVSDPTPRGQLETTLLLPLPLFGSMSIGLLIGSHRLLSLSFLVVAIMVGVWLRRFGPRGVGTGLVIFQGGFMGFFLHPQIPAGMIGWVAAELAIGVAAALVARFVLVRPHNGRTLVRMQRAWAARGKHLVELADRLFDPTLDTPHHTALAEQLRRQEVRVNEATLMIDAQLAQPGSTSAATLLHGRLYDLELAVSNVARFSDALSRRPLTPKTRSDVRSMLQALRDSEWSQASERATRLGDAADDPDPTTLVLLRRLAGSVRTVTVAMRHWLALGEAHESSAADDNYVPAIALTGGFLPGSAPASSRASTTPGRGSWIERVVLAPELRASLQVGVASVIAIAAGDAVNGRRFYWGLLAVFLAFMATTNAGEQIQKAIFRALGTAIGIVVGDLLVHATGENLVVVFGVVLVSLFLGIYLIRVNYMFMVIGITVTMSQLYQQLGEFSWHLLTLRLLETAIGTAAVIVAVVVVFPLRPQRVLQAAALTYFEALQALVGRAADAIAGAQPSESERDQLRGDVRQLDAAFHTLVMTARPLRTALLSADSTQLGRILTVASAARYYARNLASGVEAWRAEGISAEPLGRAVGELTGSMDAIRQRLAIGPAAARQTPYTRSSAYFDAVDRSLEGFDGHAVIGDFMMLDATLARLASALKMPITDHDTTADTALVASQRAGVAQPA